MARRRLIVATVTVLALAVAFNAYLFQARRPAWRINRSNFTRIEKGMTVEEVSLILGAPPGDHTVFKKPYSVGWAVPPSHRVPGGVATPSTSVQWNGDAGTILLRLKDGKVTLRLFCGHKEGDSLSPDYEDWESGKGL